MIGDVHLRQAARFAGGAVVGVGLLILVGWMGGGETLRRGLPRFRPVNVATGGCLAMLGLALCLVIDDTRRQRRAAVVLAAIAMGLAALRLLAYLARFDPLFDHPWHPAADGVRMTHDAAASIVLVSASLLALGSRFRRGITWAQILALLTALGTVLTLVATTLSHQSGEIRGMIPMTPYGVVAFLLLAGGIVLARPDHGIMAVIRSDSAAGVIARRLLPAAVLAPALVGWLRTMGQRAGLFTAEFGAAMGIMANIGFFVALVSWTAVTLHRAERRRVRLEEAVRESEAFYHSLVETVPQSIFRKDLEGRFTFANQRFCAEVGMPLERIQGRTDLELFPEDLAKKYRADDVHVVETGSALETVEENVGTTGEVRLVQVVKTPVRDVEGQIIGTQGIFWDVTDRLRFEKRLEEKNAELEDLAQSERLALEELKKTQSRMVQAEKLVGLGQMVAGVAHEINNPLAFVLNNVVVLQRDIEALRRILEMYREGDEVLKEHMAELAARINELATRIDLTYTLGNLQDLCGRSREGLRRIQHIVKDLRDFARLDESERQETDLNAGIESTVNIVRGRGKRKNVTVEMGLTPLPKVTCYPAKVNQVFMNLLANAIDASPENGTVRITSAAVDGEVRVEVSDDGPGIPEEIRGRIFDPFFTTKPPGEGTGLGLSISYGIIEDHGGDIEVESRRGEGARFRVRLPVRGGGGGTT